jgi:GNAT superfamily N-acetyltransferase
MDTIKVETYAGDELSDADDEAIRRLGEVVYPPGSLDRFTFPESSPPPEIDWPPARRSRVFLVRRDGAVVSMSVLRPRRIKTPDGPMDVMALASVKTHPEYRHRGLGRAVVRAAFAYVDDGTFPLSLFQTGVPEFYRKLNCRVVDNPFVNSLGNDPQISPWWDDEVMIYPAEAVFPQGEIDLLGPGW